MMAVQKRCVLLIVALLMVVSESEAQSGALRLNLDESGTTYIKAAVRNQFWARYSDFNPGTTISGEPVSHHVDFSIRRLRIPILAQLTPKLYVFTMFGANNINFGNAKSFQFDALDLNAEYSFSDKIAVGMGKSAWNGLSRLTTRSSKSLMTLDAPLFSLLTVNKNDVLSRGLGAWIKGQIGKFDYQVSVQNPVVYGVEVKEGVTDFVENATELRTAGYVKYEFFDNESNKSAYSGGAGTHLGKKRIFNIGVGFLNQPRMTARLENGHKKVYDFNNYAIEAFYDSYLNRDTGTAITSYLGYFSTDFGKDYVRNVGANDYTQGGTSFNGSGLDYPMMGTGSTYFFQFGYLLPKRFLSSVGRLQPNVSVQYSDFEKLKEAVVVFDIGLNVCFDGHSNKLTVNLQSRPVFDKTNLTVDDRKLQFVVQYQIEIN